jgi:protein-tyrosine phosphatase
VGIELIGPGEGPRVAGLSVPEALWWAIRSPAALAGMSRPDAGTPWPALHDAGLRDVVSLVDLELDPFPLARLAAPELEDLCGGRRPADPQRQEARVREAAGVVLRSLEAGRGVVVHCEGGTGRTGTVIGCVLRALGGGAGEVVTWLDRVHRARARDGWPESPWQDDVVRGRPAAR